ncbi:DUF2971 domain-containing protein [uncultured Phycicoccus sp.]|uniref:DUF2971 domain-containing protein n=1 Tax=uncultured Phycicoccus sp. TaxID=661422 RepID=UPI00345BCCBF
MSNLYDWLSDPREPANSPHDEALPAYLFRYLAPDGLLHTIQSRALRMNAWSQMNDPREARQWVPRGELRASGSYHTEALMLHVDSVLRRSARLLSLTEDRRPTTEESERFLFHRGWARAAMWAHYADSHRGVCLVLETAALMEAVRNMPARLGRYTTWGRVRYADVPITIGLAGSFADQSALDDALENFLDQRYTISDLHMLKNTDWSDEMEVRLATIDLSLSEIEMDKPLSFPIGACLRGVVFGDAHASPQLVASGIRSEMGTAAPEMFLCRWTDGLPNLQAFEGRPS